MNLEDAKILGEGYIEMYKLNNWKFEFNRSKKTFGLCKFGRKVISLSKFLCETNPEHEVEITIKHEIAHALVGLNHGHDRDWKSKCVEMGITPSQYYNEAGNGRNVIPVEKKNQYQCPNCKHIFGSHRAWTIRHSCSICHHGKFDWNYVLVKIK